MCPLRGPIIGLFRPQWHKALTKHPRRLQDRSGPDPPPIWCEISWNPSDCAHSYNIYRSINNSKFEFVENTKNLDFKDLILKNAQYYSYRVTGISKAGEGAFSSQSINLLTRPDSPTNIESDLISSNSIALNWSSTKTSSSYKIYISKDSGINFHLAGSSLTNNFKVNGLDDDKIHFFKITSINSGGESKKSEIISFRTLPLPPSEFSASTLNKSSILLKWNLSN